MGYTIQILEDDEVVYAKDVDHYLMKKILGMLDYAIYN